METKKRLIFCLLYSEGYFCHSRNFRCQKVGDYNWLFNNYNFANIAKCLDELIILNVTPQRGSYHDFLEDVRKIVKNVFIPVTIGGGINELETARNCFLNGADKIVLNSLLLDRSEKISLLANTYGSQSIVGSLNYVVDKGQIKVFDWRNDEVKKQSFIEYVKDLELLGFGELLINSVDMDGTGFGFDIESLKSFTDKSNLPLICMGGAGKYEHFYEVFKNSAVEAASTANLLNFIGDSINNVRSKLIQENVNLADFKQKLI
jgi:imidazole glycerol-phosphate synthase subunit HisF